MELIILCGLALFAYFYRVTDGKNATGQTYKYVTSTIGDLYEKYAPYSFKTVREKTKELGQEYTTKQYVVQVIVFAVVAGGIAYLYFFSLLMAILYAIIAVLFISYLAYL